MLTEDLAREAVTAEKLGSEAVTSSRIEKEAVGEAQLAGALRKLIPVATGRSGEMFLGKITIASGAVSATGPIVVSAEGSPLAAGLTVVSRKAGTSFTVESTVPTSDRVDWAIYAE